MGEYDRERLLRVLRELGCTEPLSVIHADCAAMWSELAEKLPPSTRPWAESSAASHLQRAIEAAAHD